VTPRRDEGVKLWYVATLRWMLGAMQLHVTHFQRAGELYQDDAVIEYLRGCLHEAFASSRIQSIASALSGTNPRRGVGSTRTELSTAETFLKRSTRGSAFAAEAYLRLSDGSTLRYFGYLFLGSALESAGSPDEAKAAYTQASRIYPDADSPLLALSRLDASAGDYQGALATLRPMLQHSRGALRDDPWLRYYVAAGRGAEDEVTAAYTALLKEDVR
jgi:tetratricopeptide (TPR) repeat protein